ncbi:MAG: hemerythrin [Bacteroides sp. SM23_62]|nr:MAG: hemerythrin [Bacteroides sp. SM23_62]
MADFSNTSEGRKELLKHMILQLHKGEAPGEVRKRLVELLKSIPYNEVVQVEQDLINEGLPEEEVLKFCDIHTQVLEGHIDTSGAKEIPEGHPVDTFKKENKELMKQLMTLNRFYEKVKKPEDIEYETYLIQLKAFFNNLMDVEKHYLRKENLLFPYLEKYNITGPPKVMWGKHDETRELLKSSMEALNIKGSVEPEELDALIEMVLKPTSQAIADMIMKEEEILFPMCMDKLTDIEWYEIAQQSIEIGFCLYDPETAWKPEGIASIPLSNAKDGMVQLPSGKLAVNELVNILNALPVEITFVDGNDKVKYFSQGKDQIFKRNRAILGRDVRLCHPPKSVHVVEQVVSDFKTGKQNEAAFWIEMNGRFIYIVYYAIRDENNKYLGTMEVVQDVTKIRNIKGEQRLLSYLDRNEK